VRVEADGACARIDLLEPQASGRSALIALANAIRPGESALDDLAFTLALARRAGIDVESASVLHWNPDCARGVAEPPARALAKRTVVTREVEFLARDVPARIAALREVLEREDEPEVEPSPHCRRPEPCPFLSRCTAAKPDDWIGFLPGLRQPESDALRERGVTRMGELPEDATAPPAQVNARAACARGGTFAAPDLARRLEAFAPEADALDFEAILPEVPLFPGTRPLEAVPFQWSAHLASGDGRVEHAEFLAEAHRDPRRSFAESLLAAFRGRERPIAVYSDFEAETLAALGRAFPELEPELARLRARLRDLLPVVRRSVYHPAFRGSFGLKRIAPVLVPGFGFDDLGALSDGGAAARAWHEMALGEADAERTARLRAALSAYCARDSLALVRVLEALRGLAKDAR
jgi:predicted RecB family nuclease